MIDRDNGTSLPNTFSINFNSRFRERSVDIVYRNRVVRVCSAKESQLMPNGPQEGSSRQRLTRMKRLQQRLIV